MKSTTSVATIQELRQLFSSYGLLEMLISDNGPQFTSDEFQQFLRLNRVKHVRSAPYHPSSNGAAERFIRTFKHSLRAGSPNLPFHHQLMNFLLSYRTTPHASTKMTPAELFLGRPLRTNLDLLHPSVEDSVTRSQAQQKRRHDQHARARDFILGQRVLVQNYRQGPRWVPGTITNRLGPLTYTVQVAGGRLWKRHIDQLLETADSPRDSTASTNSDPAPELVDYPPTSPSLPDPDLDTLPAATPESASASSEQSPPRRYPQRTRRQPDRYQDTYIHT